MGSDVVTGLMLGTAAVHMAMCLAQRAAEKRFSIDPYDILGKNFGEKSADFLPSPSSSCLSPKFGILWNFKELRTTKPLFPTKLMASEAKGRWFDPSQPRHFLHYIPYIKELRSRQRWAMPRCVRVFVMHVHQSTRND